MSAMNLTFTFLFTLELVVNMFATLVVEFLGDAWNWFDSVVVLVSLISVFLDSLPGVSVLRLLRAFRVFRLFKRIPSLRQILVAINQSVPPMLNAFALVTLLTSIYAIMAVTFFKEFWPELFGDFVTSSFTMFQIMTGDQWGDIARELFVLTDNGPAVAVFFVSYQLLVALVLVNVVIAVLLEEFAKAAAAEKETGSKVGLMEKGGGSGAFAERCPLERLVVCLQNFADSEDFEMKIHVMFLRLTHSAGLVDGGADVSTRLDSHTFRSGMAKYGMVPPIYFTPDDWERLVVQEGLAGEDGRIGYVEFGILVRQAFRRNQLREMTHVMESAPTQWTRAAVQVAMMSVKSVLLEGSYGAADIYSLPLVEGEESRHVSRHDETQDGLLSRISSAAPAASMPSLVEQVGEEVKALQRRMGDMEVAVLGRELGQESARGRSHSLGDNDNGGGKQDEFNFSNLLSIFTPQKQANGNPPPTDPAIARRRSDPEEERLSARGQANAAKSSPCLLCIRFAAADEALCRGNGWNLFGGVMPFLDQAKPPPPMQSAESSPAVTPPMSPVEPVEISSWRPARVR